MTQKKFLSAASVGQRYETGPKWVWHQMKNDPRFPKGVRFSGGMTRWSEDDLAAYDQIVLSENNHR